MKDVKLVETKLNVSERLYQGEFNQKTSFADTKKIVKEKLIVAKKLDLNTDSPLFKKYLSVESRSGFLQKLTIACDDLTISAALKIAGLDLEVFARRLTFGTNGSIDSSGQSFDHKRPNEDYSEFNVNYVNDKGKEMVKVRKRAAASVAGTDAGSLSIFCQTLQNNSSAKKILVARGGNGQAALAGKNGEDGRDADESERATNLNSALKRAELNHGGASLATWEKVVGSYYDVSEIDDKDKISDYDKNLINDDFSIHTMALKHDGLAYNSDLFWEMSAKYRATSGSDAVIPGVPGDGGEGGDLTTNQQHLTAWFTGTGGEPGKKAEDVVGGKSGTPANWCTMKYTLESKWSGSDKFTQKIIEHGCFTSGDDGVATAGKRGEAGHVKTNCATYAWIHPALVEMILSYAKDAYLNGAYEELNELLLPYLSGLQEVKIEESPLWESNNFIQLGAARLELQQFVGRLNNGLDYFGNPGGFMPSISFTAAKDFYEKKVDSQLFIIMASSLLLDEYEDSKNVKDLIHEVTTQKLEQNEKLEQGIRRAWKVIDELGPVIEQLEKDAKAQQKKIDKEEKSILANAKDKEFNKRALQLSCKAGAIACMAIPYGQPALGQIGGNALNALADGVLPLENGEKVEFSEAINFSNLKDAYSALKKNKSLNTSVEKTRKKMEASTTQKSYYLNEEKYKKSQAAKDNFLNDQILSLRAEAIENVGGIMSRLKVNDAVLNKIYEDMRKFSLELRKITAELVVLNDQRKRRANELETAMRLIGKNESLITQNLFAVGKLNDENILDADMNPVVAQIIGVAQREAIDKIYQFRYLVVKAYEAAFLTPFEKAFTLKKFISEMRKMIQATSSTAGFIAKVQEQKETIKRFLLEDVEIKKDEIDIMLSTDTRPELPILIMDHPDLPQQLNKYSDRLYQLDEPTIIAMVDVLDFPASSRLRKHYNAKLTGINLSHIEFEITDNTGEKMEKSGEGSDGSGKRYTYVLRGEYEVIIHAKNEGVAHKNETSSYMIRPELSFSKNWTYSFRTGKKSDNGKPLITNDIAHQLSEHHTLSKEEIIAPPPVATKLQLELIRANVSALKTYEDGSKDSENLLVKLKKLEFGLTYSSSLNPIREKLRVTGKFETTRKSK